jgi:hypothetical protein
MLQEGRWMGQAARKLTAKDTNQTGASAADGAGLGRAAGQCRRGLLARRIDRTSFYDWKRCFQLRGLDGVNWRA